MIHIIIIAVFTLLACGCSHEEKPLNKILSKAEFTKVFISKLQTADPHLSILQKDDLELLVKNSKGREHNVFLGNVYKEYQLNPAEIDILLDNFVQSEIKAFSRPEDATINIDNIIPVIKDAMYPLKMKQSLTETGYKTEEFNLYFEPLNEQLAILYATHIEESLKFLRCDEIDTLGLDTKALREKALMNLRARIPEIGKRGDDGLYLVCAGGNYEASLLLLDTLWSADIFKVKGDIVVVAPCNDMLFVTGSEDIDNLSRVRKAAEQIMKDAGYPISSALFVRREGKWVLFDE